MKRNQSDQEKFSVELKKNKVQDDTILLAAVKTALEGKELDETWDTLDFFISIVNCDGEMVNTDIPSDGNKVLHGRDLSPLQYLVIMAVGYYLDEIQVDGAVVSLTSLLKGWCTIPEAFAKEDEDDEDNSPDAIGCRKYSNNIETYGCLYSKFETCKNPKRNYRVIRAGE